MTEQQPDPAGHDERCEKAFTGQRWRTCYCDKRTIARARAECVGLRAQLDAATKRFEELRDERAILWPKAQALPAVQASADHFEAERDRSRAQLDEIRELCDRAEQLAASFNVPGVRYLSGVEVVKLRAVLADTPKEEQQ